MDINYWIKQTQILNDSILTATKYNSGKKYYTSAWNAQVNNELKLKCKYRQFEHSYMNS